MEPTIVVVFSRRTDQHLYSDEHEQTRRDPEGERLASAYQGKDPPRAMALSRAPIEDVVRRRPRCGLPVPVPQPIGPRRVAVRRPRLLRCTQKGSVARKAAALALATVLVSCSTPGPKSPDDRSSFGAAGERWERLPGDALSTGVVTAHARSPLAPGEGIARWLVGGSTTEPGTGLRMPVAWSSADASAWERATLPLPPGASAAEAAALSRSSGKAVAVGWFEREGGDVDGAVWTSSDGRAWQLAGSDTNAFGGAGKQRLTAAAGGPRGFVALGHDDQDGRVTPAVWTSADGTSWRRVAGGAGHPFGERSRLFGVAVGAAGAVVVGTVGFGTGSDGAMWWSADGERWEQLSGDGAALGGPGEQQVNDVTATTSGFVAVGYDLAPLQRRRAAVWTSRDGKTWQRALAPPRVDEDVGTDGVSVLDVAGSGPLVAIGGGGRTSAVWTSVDGIRWTREQLPSEMTFGPSVEGVATDGQSVLATTGAVHPIWARVGRGSWRDVSSAGAFPPRGHSFTPSVLLRAGDQLVAFVHDYDPEDDPARGGTTSTALWQSADGRSWKREPRSSAFHGAEVYDATAWRGGLVAVGKVVNEGKAVAWVSADGRSWEAVGSQPGFDSGASIYGVVPGGPGLVAVGDAYVEGRQRGRVWVSADGRRWEQAPDHPEWLGPGDNVVSAVCPLPTKEVVAVGYRNVGSEQQLRAWTSADGRTWSLSTGDAAFPAAAPGNPFPARCVGVPSGVVLVGNRDAGDQLREAAVWRSSDGRSWATVPGVPAGRYTHMAWAAVDGQRVIVTGRDGDDTVVWSSPDEGRTWQRAASPDFAGLGSQDGRTVAFVGSAAVVLGRDGNGVAVWISR